MVSVVSGCSIVSVAKCLTRCLSSPPVWLALMLCEQLLWFFGRGNRFVSGKCLFPPPLQCYCWRLKYCYQELFFILPFFKKTLVIILQRCMSVLRLTLKISVDVRAVQTQMGSCPSTVFPIHSYQTLLTSFWLPVLTGKCLVKLS